MSKSGAFPPFLCPHEIFINKISPNFGIYDFFINKISYLDSIGEISKNENLVIYD